MNLTNWTKNNALAYRLAHADDYNIYGELIPETFLVLVKKSDCQIVTASKTGTQFYDPVKAPIIPMIQGFTYNECYGNFRAHAGRKEFFNGEQSKILTKFWSCLYYRIIPNNGIYHTRIFYPIPPIAYSMLNGLSLYDAKIERLKRLQKFCKP